MHIIVQSEVGLLESTNQYLWQLCDPMQLSGEGGYYLTVYSSIVSLLHRVSLPALATAMTLDDAIQEEENDTVGNVGVLPPDGDKDKWKSKVKFWK